ncbi:MAG: DUF4062 domain-containing protein [Candidatus Cloacimonetes bacterium]|nr:DUF4062 domain-containing protein [Candidatus Cloacimonadota bacterium]
MRRQEDEKREREIDRGNYMQRRRKIIRVFVSSTFEDFKLERDALQLRAFKNLRTYCQKQGWQFQAVDLRWGIT